MGTPRFYDLFATYRGPSPHWQYLGTPRVKDVARDYNGQLVAPLPNWHVQAQSVEQACWFVRHSVTSAKHADGLGVWSWPKWEAAQELKRGRA